MEVREPKYSVGDKVIDKKDNIGTVYSVYSYYFDKDEYFYSVEESGSLKVKSEKNINSYERGKKNV